MSRRVPLEADPLRAGKMTARAAQYDLRRRSGELWRGSHVAGTRDLVSLGLVFDLHVHAAPDICDRAGEGLDRGALAACASEIPERLVVP